MESKGLSMFFIEKHYINSDTTNKYLKIVIANKVKQSYFRWSIDCFVVILLAMTVFIARNLRDA